MQDSAVTKPVRNEPFNYTGTSGVDQDSGIQVGQKSGFCSASYTFTDGISLFRGTQKLHFV